jgi:hypothetical protein
MFLYYGTTDDIIANFDDEEDEEEGALLVSKRPGGAPGTQGGQEVAHVGQTWFHDGIDREEARRRLHLFNAREGHNGSFLVRSRSSGDPFALSLWYNGRCFHILIIRDANNLYGIADNQGHGSLYDVIEYHTVRGAALRARCPARV